MPAPIVTPSVISARGTDGGINLSSTQATIWGCTGGVLSNQTMGTARWTPTNRTGNYSIFAVAMSDGAFTTVPATVTAVLPFDPGEGSSGRTEKKVFVSQSISRRRQFRTKSGARRRYDLAFPNREESELDEIESFFAWHAPAALGFYWTNKTLLQERLFTFMSEAIDWTPQSHTSFDYKFQIREKSGLYPPPLEGLLILDTLGYYPDYAYDAKTLQPLRASEAVGGKRIAATEGAQERSYILKYLDRDPAEFLAVEAFWNRHYPARAFNYVDPTRDIAGVFRFDSDISHRDLLGIGIDYTVAITQFVGASPLGALPASGLPEI